MLKFNKNPNCLIYEGESESNAIYFIIFEISTQSNIVHQDIVIHHWFTSLPLNIIIISFNDNVTATNKSM